MITFRILLYESNILKDGSHPIYIQATRKIRQGKYEIKRRSLNISAKPTQWDEERSRLKKNYPNYAQYNDEIAYIEEYARNIAFTARREKQRLTADEFLDKVMDQEDESTKTVYEFFTERMEELSAGNRVFYKDCRDYVARYAGKDLIFQEIDYNFLIGFEKWLRNPPKDAGNRKGCNDGGVGKYMRTLGALYNEAFKREIFVYRYNPFDSKSPKSIDKSKMGPKIDPNPFTPEEWKLWKEYQTDNPNLKFWHDFSLHLYYCVGMRFSDGCYFHYTYVKGNRISYDMKKTGKHITYIYHPEARKIAAQYYLDGSGDGGYVFPILNSSHKTEQQQLDRRKKKIKQANKAWQFIAMELGIRRKVTSKTFRYTMVYNLKSSGIDKAVISDLMRHYDEKTLKHYDAILPDEVLMEAVLKL